MLYKKLFSVISAGFLLSILASNQGCNPTGTNGVATFDEVICGHSSYEYFNEQNPSYTPISDQEVWISSEVESKSSKRRKYQVSPGNDQYMNYPLKNVAMSAVDGELHYFFTYLPESSTFMYEGLEDMVVVVYNCMGRKIKNINYGETSPGKYEDVVDELFDKSQYTYFYSGYYIIDLWRVS